MATSGPSRLSELLKRPRVEPAHEVIDLCDSDDDAPTAPTPSKRPRLADPPPTSSSPAHKDKGKGKAREVIDVDDDEALPKWAISPVLPPLAPAKSAPPVAGPSRPRPPIPAASAVEQLLALLPGLDRDEAKTLLADPKAAKHGASAVNAVADHLFSLNGDVRRRVSDLAQADSRSTSARPHRLSPLDRSPASR